jgi:predicted dehydrogenase
MGEPKDSTRREFIKLVTASTVVAGSSIRTIARDRRAEISWTDSARGTSANDKIRIATIGIGGQGTSDTTAALKVAGVELVAVADVYDGRLARAREVWGSDIFTTREYHEILARADVDAVIVATPDHWHMQVSMDALNAGKHVYCEKPMVHSVEEGHRLIETQRKTGRVFQVGSQRVSSIVYHKARELLASGAIGELNLVEAWWDRNSAIGAWQYSIPPDASPSTVDWDRFIGTAPARPFEPIRLFRWRNYRDYGTGVAGDLFVHLFSGLHLVTGSKGPVRAMTTGGLRYWKDGRDVPDVMIGLFDYPATNTMPPFNLTLKVDFADGAGESSGLKFIGSEGVMSIGADVSINRKERPAEPGYSINTFPKAVQDEFLKQYRERYPKSRPRLATGKEEVYAPPSSYSDHVDHFTNFFEAIRSAGPSIEDATFGLRAAGPALLSNLCYFDNRIYGWDPDQMRISSERQH